MSFEEAKAVVFNGKSGLWIWLFFGLRNWVLGFLPRMDLGSKFFFNFKAVCLGRGGMERLRDREIERFCRGDTEERSFFTILSCFA